MAMLFVVKNHNTIVGIYTKKPIAIGIARGINHIQNNSTAAVVDDVRVFQHSVNDASNGWEVWPIHRNTEWNRPVPKASRTRFRAVIGGDPNDD